MRQAISNPFKIDLRQNKILHNNYFLLILSEAFVTKEQYNAMQLQPIPICIAYSLFG